MIPVDRRGDRLAADPMGIPVWEMSGVKEKSRRRTRTAIDLIAAEAKSVIRV